MVAKPNLNKQATFLQNEVAKTKNYEQIFKIQSITEFLILDNILEGKLSLIFSSQFKEKVFAEDVTSSPALENLLPCWIRVQETNQKIQKVEVLPAIAMGAGIGPGEIIGILGTGAATTTGYSGWRATRNQSRISLKAAYLETNSNISTASYVRDMEKLGGKTAETIHDVQQRLTVLEDLKRENPQSLCYQKQHKETIKYVHGYENAYATFGPQKSTWLLNKDYKLVSDRFSDSPKFQVKDSFNPFGSIAHSHISNEIESSSSNRYIAMSAPSGPVFVPKSEPSPFIEAVAWVLLGAGLGLLSVKAFKKLFQGFLNQNNMIVVLEAYRKKSLGKTEALFILMHQWRLSKDLAEKFLESKLEESDLDKLDPLTEAHQKNFSNENDSIDLSFEKN